MADLTKAIRGTKAKLRSVREVLNKRIARVAKCKAQQQIWKRRLIRARKHGWEGKLEEAQKKLAYWHEQLDKAKLGVKAYEKREARLEKKLRWLKEHDDPEPSPTSGVSSPDRPWNPGNRTVANWFVPWLDKSWAAGWRGQVNSGWRSPAYSTSLCINMCGSPSCPGRCAGSASNHSGSTYPAGAIDVSDYYTFKAVQYRIGSPLRNALGAQDPVHFSVSGR